MINNYLGEEYQSSNKVYTHPELGTAIYLGDVEAALDVKGLMSRGISTVVTAAAGM